MGFAYLGCLNLSVQHTNFFRKSEQLSHIKGANCSLYCIFKKINCSGVKDAEPTG
jgi:hypothetical protein